MNNSWRVYKFSEAPIAIIDGDRGKNYPKRNEFSEEGYCLFLNANNVTKEGFSFNSKQFITKEKDELLRSGKLSRGDVVMTTRGTIGNVVYYGDRVPFEHVRINSGMVIFRCERDKILPLFLFQYLRSPIFQAQINAFRSGVAQPQLPICDIKRMTISIPSLPEQYVITTIISAYDDLIENNTRRIKILEEMAQVIYQEWFVNFRFPGHEKVRFVNSELGKIPEGWEVRKVADILEKVKRRKKVKKQNYEPDGLIPVVDQGRDFIGGYTTDTETLHSTPLPIIVFGDHTRVLKYVDFPFACGADGTQLLKPSTERMPISLFYYALKSIDLSDFAYSRHFKFLKEKKVIIPDEQTARLFEEMVKPLREQIKCLWNRNNNLRRTRDLLLPKLISGKLDVSNLDIMMENNE